MAAKTLEGLGYDQAVTTVTEKICIDGAAALGAILERSRRESEERMRQYTERLGNRIIAVMGTFIAAMTAILAVIIQLS